MLSLTELERAARVLGASLSGSTVKRVVQTDEFSLVLTLQPPDTAEVTSLLLTCGPRTARVSRLEEPPRDEPPAHPMIQYLRAHLVRGRLETASILDKDRQLLLRIRGKEMFLQILLSIMGTRSNIYALDETGIVRVTLRPLEATRKDLALGSAWKSPPPARASEREERWKDVPDSTYLRAIEETYAALELEKRLEELTRAVAQALAKEAEFLSRKSANLHADLSESIRAAEYKRQGELLKGAIHRVRAGDRQITVRDFDTGEEITIELDPRLSPSENLENYFRKYQKEQRGVDALRQQIELVEGDRRTLARLQIDFEAAKRDLARLEEFKSRPAVRRLLVRHVPVIRPQRRAGPVRKEIPSRLLPKRFLSADGWEIWVGRSDEGNDYLTTRLARGNDLFFHLDGSPGSHVVLRTEGRLDSPPDSLLDACELAVHFSKQKNATRADVHVTPMKNVKKPKGAKPGLVHVLRGKTIHLRRDRRRLERVLSSRLEE